MPKPQKAEFDAFLSTPVPALAGRTWPMKRFFIGVDEHIEPMHRDGVLTPWWQEYFCMGYPLGVAHAHTLGLAFDGRLSDARLEDVDVLQRCGLLDNGGNLTEAGRYKYISTLPLTQQVDRLDIAYAEVPASVLAGQNVTTESYVLEKYKRLGFECAHDEGSSFSYLVKLALLGEIPTLKQLLNHDPFARDSKHFSEATNLGTFRDLMDNGMLAISESKRNALLGIIAKASVERLGEAHEALERSSSATQSRRVDCAFEQVISLFKVLGVGRMMQLAQFLMADERHWGGWPDITCIQEGAIVLVEVKKNDTLMFQQARAIAKLKSLSPALFREIRVERVVRA